jgi:hypothetical protein
VNCKSIIALGLGCLSIGILLPSFPDTALAKPVFERSAPTGEAMKKIIQRNVRLSGNLIPTDSAGLSYPVYQTACSQITVSVLRGNEVSASTQAVGSTISNGCTYTLDVTTGQYTVAGQYKIDVISRPRVFDYVIWGKEDIPQPFPSQFDLKVYKFFVGPK